MKLGLIADPHYSSAGLTCGKRYNSASLVKLEKAMRHFEENACDLVVILGDLTDTEASHELEAENVRKVSALLDRFSVPTLCLMGNHDAFVFTEDEFYQLLGEARRPRLIETEPVSLLFLDACYSKSGAHYTPGNVDWTDTFYPHTAQLEDTLSRLTGSVCVFMHQNIDPDIREDHRLYNAARIREILEKSGKVRAVYQGHYHPGHGSVHRGIEYVTLPAMCENEEAWRIVTPAD